jgi:hypothetical protein
MKADPVVVDAAILLAAVDAALKKYGRPRKNPGGERPVAILTNGVTVQSGMKLMPRHTDKIRRLSLPGAFRYAEISGKIPKISAENAKRAFYDAHYPERNGQQPIQIDLEIDKIDQDTYDSRQIQRNLAKAAKKLRKAALESRFRQSSGVT